MENQRVRWSSQSKLVVLILLLGLAFYLLYRFSEVLPPLALAVILAYILTPAVNFIQQRLKLRRGVAVFLVYLGLLLGLGGLLGGVIPVLVSQWNALNLDVQRFLQSVNTILERRLEFAGISINLERSFESLLGSLQGVLEPVFGHTLGFAIELITSVVWLIFIFVVSFYLVKDMDALRQWSENVVPPAYREDTIRLRGEINHIWASFFRGQLVLALVVGTIFSIIGLVLGLPFPLAMGLLAGLLEFLPSVGHGIWLTIAALLALFAGSTWLPLPNWVFMLILIGLHLVFQQFDLNYLIPRIIGRSVHLPPLVVILGIVTGALLAGVLGILLAAPTIASARVVGRYLYANLFDLDPFPDNLVYPLPPPNPHWWRTAYQRAFRWLTGKIFPSRSQ